MTTPPIDPAVLVVVDRRQSGERRFRGLGGSLRRGLLGLLTLVALVGSTSCENMRSDRESGKPELPVQSDVNVLVISFDALRADALGAYGNQRGATPNIDAFAEQAFVYNRAYSSAPVTPTSFASLFSGQHPTRVFLGWEFVPQSSLAQYFEEAGYQTAAFVNNVQLAPERGFGTGFETYEWRRNDPDAQVLHEALEWLERRDRDKPLFFWLHLLRPHAPYRARSGAEHLYHESDHGRFATTTGGAFETTKPNEIRRIEDLYYGEVWEADRLFGRFKESVEQLGLLDDSIVVLTADHGEEFGEHGGFQHGRLYEEHLRVPLLLYHPAVQRQVVRRNITARSVDLLPTLLDITGLEHDEELDGQSLRLVKPGEQGPVIAVSMTDYPNETSLSLVDGSYKLIVNCLPTRSAELYDLRRDPGEQTDLHADDPSETRRLLWMLREAVGDRPCRTAVEAQRGRSVTRELDEESIEALRSLGYID